MQVGKLANFEGADGKPEKVTITTAHIDALMSHAGNRAIPVHLTHDWFNFKGQPNADTIEMKARVGALKSLRKDEFGDLVGDVYLKDGAERNDIIWGAKNNPEDNMISAVFGYRKDDPQFMPTDFKAADIVQKGAGVYALFSETDTETKPMADLSPETLAPLLDDPKIKGVIQGMIDGHSKAEAKMEDDEEAAMEDAAGVTDADKKPDDEQKPALMRFYARAGRAFKRQKAELSATKTAILAEAKIQSEAATTALLGKGGFLRQTGEGGEDATSTAKFNAAVKELTDKGIKPGAATQAVMRTHEAIYNDMQKERGIFKS